MARWTGLEPATPGVTGRYSNQLSYHRALGACYRMVWGPSSAKRSKFVVRFASGLRLSGRWHPSGPKDPSGEGKAQGIQPESCPGKPKAPLRGLRVVVARLTGLEPATPGVTGRYSNQLSYNRV